MGNTIAATLISLFSIASLANEAHELAKQGRWQEVGALIQSGKYDIEDEDEQGLTLGDIALNRAELEELETHCYAYTYESHRKPASTNMRVEAPRLAVERATLDSPAQPALVEVPRVAMETATFTGPEVANQVDVLEIEQPTRSWCSCCSWASN